MAKEHMHCVVARYRGHEIKSIEKCKISIVEKKKQSIYKA